jgi:hypothetical protein
MKRIFRAGRVAIEALPNEMQSVFFVTIGIVLLGGLYRVYDVVTRDPGDCPAAVCSLEVEEAPTVSL